MNTAVGRNYTYGKSDAELIGHIGFGHKVEVNKESEKKVLITGAGSYIGESFIRYATEKYTSLKIDAIDMLDGTWKEKDVLDTRRRRKEKNRKQARINRLSGTYLC